MQITQVLQDLRVSLDDLIYAYSQILGATERQRAALISRDEPALSVATSETGCLMASTTDAENRRRQHTLALARLISTGDIDNSRVTLSQLVALADQLGQQQLARALEESRSKLKGLISQIRDINQGNAAIIQRRLAYGRFVVGMVAGVNGYGADGIARASRVSRMSINA